MAEFTLAGDRDGTPVEQGFASLDAAIEAAYAAVAHRSMRPVAIRSAAGEIVLGGKELIDAMWIYWGETEY